MHVCACADACLRVFARGCMNAFVCMHLLVLVSVQFLYICVYVCASFCGFFYLCVCVCMCVRMITIFYYRMCVVYVYVCVSVRNSAVIEREIE